MEFDFIKGVGDVIERYYGFIDADCGYIWPDPWD